jgi:hypothetical protein
LAIVNTGRRFPSRASACGDIGTGDEAFNVAPSVVAVAAVDGSVGVAGAFPSPHEMTETREAAQTVHAMNLLSSIERAPGVIFCSNVVGIG